MSCLAWPSSFSLRILWVVYCWPILEVDPKNNAVFRRDSVLFLLMNSMFLLTTYSVHDGVADMHLDQLNRYHLVGPFVHSTLMPEFWPECQFHWDFFFLQSVDPLLEDTYQWSIKPPMYYMCLVQIDSPILPFKASCPVSNDSHSNIQPVIQISNYMYLVRRHRSSLHGKCGRDIHLCKQGGAQWKHDHRKVCMVMMKIKLFV